MNFLTVAADTAETQIPYATIFFIILYVAIIAVLTFLGNKKTKTAQDYIIAGRDTNPFIMALSYGATFISTSAIVGFGGVAANFGMGLLWLCFLNIFVGVFIAFVFFGRRTRKMSVNISSSSFPELIGKRFDSKFIQIFIGSVIFIFMPIYAAAVLKGGVDFIATTFNLNYDFALLILTAIVAITVTLGGLKGVMYVDSFQAIIMSAGILFLVIFTYIKLGGVVEAHTQLTELIKNPAVIEQTQGNIDKGFLGWTSMPSLGSPIWWNIVSSIILGVGIGVLAQPQLAVRFMTVKSNRDLNRALLSGGLFIVILVGGMYTVGSLSNVVFFQDLGKISMVAAGGVNDRIIPKFINDYIPSWFNVVFILALLSAAMSTLGSQFHTMGIAFSKDIYMRSVSEEKRNKINASKKQSILLTRIGMYLSIVITFVLAWLSSKLDGSVAIIATGTSLFFGLCAASFLPSFFAGLYIKKMPKTAAIASIISGFISSIIMIFFINEKTATNLQLCRLITGKPYLIQGTAIEYLKMVDSIVISLPISIIVMVICYFVCKNTISDEHIEKCFQSNKKSEVK